MTTRAREEAMPSPLFDRRLTRTVFLALLLAVPIGALPGVERPPSTTSAMPR